MMLFWEVTLLHFILSSVLHLFLPLCLLLLLSWLFRSRILLCVGIVLLQTRAPPYLEWWLTSMTLC